MSAALVRPAATLPPAIAITASAAAPQTAQELVEISTRLAELLEEETAALVAMRLAEAGRFGKEKQRLTRLYRAALEELRAGRTNLRNAAAAVRSELIAVATRLARAAGENERALRAGRAAVERMVGAIAEAIGDNRMRIAAYGPPRPAPARLTAIGGVAFDRRL